MSTFKAILGQERRTGSRHAALIRHRTEKSLDVPRPDLFLFVFFAWFAALIWFHPRMVQLFELSKGPLHWAALAFFITFVELAWLYGFYNIGIIIFASIYRRQSTTHTDRPASPMQVPAVALLYTTCNDFVESSAMSCIRQDYPHYTVYLLDDSADPVYQKRADKFAARHPERVKVVRRPDRKGFKAGNLNHALADIASKESVFALADADEVLPPNFLKKLVPRLMNDPNCGFIQANHRSNRRGNTALAKAMGDGIDIHWRWYQPLRNRYGFVMLLGHGAVLRKSCWEKIGGFPHLVSEDLAYAVRIRELGWKGTFAEDVICYEDFPESIQAFRVRFMKWTRGTCEFLFRETKRIIFAKKVSLAEKCDILFPTLNLPLSMFYFLFIIDANVIIPMLFGTSRPLTLSFGEMEWVLPLRGLESGFEVVFSPDFFIVTILTLLAPVFCFLIELRAKPLHLFRFLCRSTTVYAALGPISSLGVFSYLMTKKATFFVTGDQSTYNTQKKGKEDSPWIQKIRKSLKNVFLESHPNHRGVQGFEVLCGLFFGLVAISMANISLLGLSIAFILHPIMHRITWENPIVQQMVYLPFLLIITGVAVGALGLLGLQPIFFGYGFHF